MTPRKQYESSDEWAAGLTAIIQRERSEAAPGLAHTKSLRRIVVLRETRGSNQRGGVS
jgi:hypothetical protein